MSDNEEILQLRADRDTLREELRDTYKCLNADRLEIDQLRAERDQLKQERFALQAHVAELKDEVRKVRTVSASRNYEMDRLRAKLVLATAALQMVYSEWDAPDICFNQIEEALSRCTAKKGKN
jgi:chromosome segregation ATPase